MATVALVETVALDPASSTINVTGASIPAGSNKRLFAVFSYETGSLPAPEVSTLTFNGVSMVPVNDGTIDALAIGGTGFNASVEVWELFDAGIPAEASAAYTLAGTLSVVPGEGSIALITLIDAAQDAVSDIDIVEVDSGNTALAFNSTAPSDDSVLLCFGSCGQFLAEPSWSTSSGTIEYSLSSDDAIDSSAHCGTSQVVSSGAVSNTLTFLGTMNRGAGLAFCVGNAIATPTGSGSPSLNAVTSTGQGDLNTSVVVDSTQASTVSEANGLLVTVPSNQDGDTLIWIQACSDSVNEYITPPGWSILASKVVTPDVVSGGTPTSNIIYSKIADSEPASYIIVGDTTAGHVGHMISIRDADGLSTAVVEASANDSTETDPDPGAVVTTDIGELVLAITQTNGVFTRTGVPALYELVEANSTDIGGLDSGGSGSATGETSTVSQHTPTADTGSIVNSVPSGTVDGDLLIWVVATENNSSDSINTPAGWSLVTADAQVAAAAASVASMWVFSRIASSEPATYTATATTAALTHAGIMLRVSGVDQSTPFDATEIVVEGASDGQPDPGAITTVTDGALVVAIGLRDAADAGGVTPPSGYTLHESISYGATNGAGGVVAVASNTIATAGSENPGAFTIGGNEQHGAVTLAIRPSALASGAGLTLTSIHKITGPAGSENPGAVPFDGQFSWLARTLAFSPASGNIEGVAATTLASIISAASGDVLVEGAGSESLAAITSSGQGDPHILASGSESLAAITASGQGDPYIQASGSESLAAITASGQGDALVEGASSASLSPIISDGQGDATLDVVGSPSIQPITSDGQGDVVILGSSDTAVSSVVSSGQGDSILEGSGSESLAAVTTSGQGDVLVEGTGSESLAAVTTSGQGDLLVEGTGSESLAAITSSGQGDLLVQGVGSTTLSPVIGSGSSELVARAVGIAEITALFTNAQGDVLVEGTGSESLSPIIAEASGELRTTSIGSAQLSSIFATASGEVLVSGSASTTIPQVLASSQGDLLVQGSGSESLAAITSSGLGNVGDVSVGAGTLTPIISEAQGDTQIHGVASAEITALVSSALGDSILQGSGSPALSAVVSDGSSDTVLQASGSPTIQSILASASGDTVLDGVGVGLLDSVVASAQGDVLVEGAGSESLASITSVGQGDTILDGAGSSILAQLLSAGLGNVGDVSVGVGTLAAVQASAQGDVLVEGAGSDTLAALVAQGSGSSTLTGTAGATLQPTVSSGVGPGPIGRLVGAAELASLTSNGLGSVADSAIGVGTLSPIFSIGQGDTLVQGSSNSVIPNLLSNGFGGSTITGEASILLSALISSGLGELAGSQQAGRISVTITAASGGISGFSQGVGIGIKSGSGGIS